MVPRKRLRGTRATDKGEEVGKCPGTRRFSEGRGQLRDPQLGPPRTRRYQRMVGGGWVTCKSHNQRKDGRHAGTYVHTPPCWEDLETGVSETSAEIWEGRKEQQDRTRRSKKGRKEGDAEESLLRSAHLEVQGQVCPQGQRAGRKQGEKSSWVLLLQKFQSTSR